MTDIGTVVKLFRLSNISGPLCNDERRARPAAIWAGVFAMVWSGIVHPILTWVWAFAEMTGHAPPLMDTGALVTMLGGLLGVSGMRSFDKHKGTANNSLK